MSSKNRQAYEAPYGCRWSESCIYIDSQLWFTGVKECMYN